MKLNFRKTFYFCSMMFFLQFCKSPNTKNLNSNKNENKPSSVNVSLLKPIDECDIKKLNDRFKLEFPNPKITFNKTYISIPKGDIDRILDNKESSYVFAVVGLDDKDKKELQVDFVASNKDGTAVSDATSFKPGKEIKKRHRNLKDRNSGGKIPLLQLEDFPIAIKMDTASLWRIRKSKEGSTSQFYYFYPGIDSAWHDEDYNDNKRHFTISVLPRKIQCIGEKTHLVEAGEETWPFESFVWYSSGDIGGLE